MEEILKKIAEHFGFAAPFGYAALAYGFFYWLDENASDEAKVALAQTMRFKDYKNEQVASALVEVFDRIYTYPLLRWRAFFRSLLFTSVVSAIFVLETTHIHDLSLILIWPLLYNFFTDYLALFVIRPLLIRSGMKPVMALVLGTVSGAAIVIAANFLRILAILLLTPSPGICFPRWGGGGDCFLQLSFAEIVRLSSLMPFAPLSYRYLHWV